MGLQDMLQWWNLIYVIPLFISVLWLAATAVAGMQEGADHDVEVDADHDADLDHDVDADNDANLDQHHTSHHLDVEHDGSLLMKAMAVLGLGKMPVTAMFGIFLLAWGAFGMFSNQLFAAVFVYPAVYIWPSMAATFFIGAILTRSMAEIFARVMPSNETYGVTRMQLIGNLGAAVFRITETTGTIHVKDQYGTLHREQAKVDPGCPEIPAGSDIIVVDFDDSDKRFIVKRSEL